LILCRGSFVAAANLGDCRAFLFDARVISSTSGVEAEEVDFITSNKGKTRGLMRACKETAVSTFEKTRFQGNGRTSDGEPPVISFFELTTPHRATDSSERARILAAGGTVVNGRVMGVLEPSRAIGDLDLKKVPRSHQAVGTLPTMASAQFYHQHLVGCPPQCLPYSPSPFLVLATDGLWDFVLPDRVAQIVRAAGGDPARSLVEEARASGSLDDVTVLVATYQG